MHRWSDTKIKKNLYKTLKTELIELTINLKNRNNKCFCQTNYTNDITTAISVYFDGSTPRKYPPKNYWYAFI